MKRKERQHDPVALPRSKRLLGDAEKNLEPDKLRQSLERVAHLIEENPVPSKKWLPLE